MKLSFTLEDREITALLLRLKARLTDMKPVMTEIGLRYERSVVENFKAEQSPDGKPWARLSAATMMSRLGARTKRGGRYGFRRDGGLSARGKRYIMGKRILWEHGDLEASVHSRADATSVRIGTGGHIPYAAIHQFGGKAGRGRKTTIPARPFLAVNQGGGFALAEKDRNMIRDLIREHLEAEL